MEVGQYGARLGVFFATKNSAAGNEREKNGEEGQPKGTGGGLDLR